MNSQKGHLGLDDLQDYNGAKMGKTKSVQFLKTIIKFML